MSLDRSVQPATSMMGPFSPQYRRLTIGIILTIAGTAFEALAIGTILPQTVDDLGNLSLYGWIFSAFMLANLIGITIAGAEVDRQGPARPYLLGMALFVVGLLLGGLAPSMPVLILSRAVQGFGGGVIAAVAYVSVGRGYPDEAKPRMLALMSSAWVVPGLVGPSVGSLIADLASWRWVFLGLIPLAAIATFLAAPAIGTISGAAGLAPGADAPDRRHILDALRLAAGATILLAGLGLSQPLFGAGLAALGGATLWAPLRRLLPAGALRAAAGQPAAIATMGLLNLGFFGFGSFLPLALTDARGQGSFVVGLSITAGTIAWTAGSWIQAHFARRASPRLMAGIGLSLLVVGMSGATLVLFEPTPVLLGPVAWGVAGLGIGLTYATLTLLILALAPVGQEGRATAAMQLANALGIAIATGIGGVLIAAFSSGDEAARAGLALQNILMIGAILLGLLAALRLPNRVPERAPEHHPPPAESASSTVDRTLATVG